MEILRKLFGPYKDEVWAQLAHEFGGDFLEGGLWNKDVVHVQVDAWEIVLDTFTRKQGKHRKTYTRIMAPFVNRDDLYFKIYRAGFFTGVAKYFGMKDIQINDEYFDKEFVIKGNDEFKITWILDNPAMKEQLTNTEHVHFEIKNNEGLFYKDDYSEGIDELYFEKRGVIKDINELRHLFQLFALILDKITELDSGYA